MISTSSLVAAALLAALPVEAVSLKGDAVRGELSSISKTQVVIATSDGPQTLPLPSLRVLNVVGAEAAPSDTDIVLQLRDKSQMNVTKFAVADGVADVTVGSANWKGPVSGLRWVRMQPFDQDPQVRKTWEALLDRQFAGDCLAFPRVSDNGGVSLEHLEGSVGDVDAETVQFTYQGETLKPKREKVQGMIYLAPRRELKESVAIVKLVDGSTLNAAELKWDNDELAVTTGAGWNVSVSADQLLSLELGSSNIVYLSDLKPTSIECEPYFGVVLDTERQAYMPRMDQDHHGEPLKVFGLDPAPKGLAIRSHTTMTYRFEKPYKKLLATVGIAEHVRDSDVTPHLVLVISSDRKKLFEKEITGADEPFPVEVDLTGVQRLIIEVQYGKSQDIADFLHLCNARVAK